MSRCNVILLNAEPIHLDDFLPGEQEKVIVGPPPKPLHEMPMRSEMETLQILLKQLGETPNFQIQNQTYIVIDENVEGLAAALFFSQAFWMFNNSPRIWVTTKIPGSYIDMSSLLMGSIDWVMQQQMKQRNAAYLQSLETHETSEEK